jgi:hypothetical protein
LRHLLREGAIHECAGHESGGNSLKVELISCSPSQQFAFEGRKLLSLAVEGIGKDPRLSVDPSLLPFLIREEHMEIDEVMTLLDKKSGLLGISENLWIRAF